MYSLILATAVSGSMTLEIMKKAVCRIVLVRLPRPIFSASLMALTVKKRAFFWISCSWTFFGRCCQVSSAVS